MRNQTQTLTDEFSEYLWETWEEEAANAAWDNLLPEINFLTTWREWRREMLSASAVYLSAHPQIRRQVFGSVVAGFKLMFNDKRWRREVTHIEPYCHYTGDRF